jgi:hypothetical protein
MDENKQDIHTLLINLYNLIYIQINQKENNTKLTGLNSYELIKEIENMIHDNKVIKDKKVSPSELVNQSLNDQVLNSYSQPEEYEIIIKKLECDIRLHIKVKFIL